MVFLFSCLVLSNIHHVEGSSQVFRVLLDVGYNSWKMGFSYKEEYQWRGFGSVSKTSNYWRSSSFTWWPRLSFGSSCCSHIETGQWSLKYTRKVKVKIIFLYYFFFSRVLLFIIINRRPQIFSTVIITPVILRCVVSHLFIFCRGRCNYS